jgi:hypothetical protein
MKKGDLVSTVEFCRVVSSEKDSVIVENIHTKLKFEIEGDELIKELNSSDDFEKEKKVTKTALAERFIKCYNVVFTVCFIKATGDERVLRGRLMSHEPLMGRSYCEDLDLLSSLKDDPKRVEKSLRQVDHRTIKYLIVEGTKYVAK